MELRITKETTLRELKKQFAKQFPNLNLQLYGQTNRPDRSLPFARHVGDFVPLGSLKRLRKEGVFTFDIKTTIADFEERLQNEFGLPVQIFRRDGGLWLGTLQTRQWSLGKQMHWALLQTGPTVLI